MRSLLAIIASAAAVMAAPASAAQFSGDYTTAYNGSGGVDGLDLKVQEIATALAFDLNVGEMKSIELFRVYTDEPSFDLDDYLLPNPFTVNFTFTSPATAGSVGGLSGAFNALLFKGGYLVWQDGGTQTFSFGNGGKLLVDLDDGFFAIGPARGGVNVGPQYAAKIVADFTLLSASVPEPATWAMMIGGLGLVGYSLRRRTVLATVGA